MRNHRRLSIILIAVGICCILACAGVRLFLRLPNRPSEETLDAFRPSSEGHGQSEGGLPESPGQPETPAPSREDLPQGAGPEPTDTQEAPPAPELVENPYRDSFLANEDMAAWLAVPDTRIDYPVMWTPRDENYYLRRGFDGRKDQNGCLILDTDSSLSPLTTNLIIHGHNMSTGAMFGELDKYQEESYFQEHRGMQLYTEEGLYTYEVIAVFRSEVYKKTDQVFKFYKFFQADTQEEFDDFYLNIKALSLYDTGVAAEFGDHFLTLSTCSYHVERGRFVVVARETGYEGLYAPFR